MGFVLCYAVLCSWSRQIDFRGLDAVVRYTGAVGGAETSMLVPCSLVGRDGQIVTHSALCATDRWVCLTLCVQRLGVTDHVAAGVYRGSGESGRMKSRRAADKKMPLLSCVHRSLSMYCGWMASKRQLTRKGGPRSP